MRSFLTFFCLFLISTTALYSADVEDIAEDSVPDINEKSQGHNREKPNCLAEHSDCTHIVSGYVTRSTKKNDYWRITMIVKKTLKGEAQSQITFFYKKNLENSSVDNGDNEVLTHHRVRSLGTNSVGSTTEPLVHRHTRTLGTNSEGCDTQPVVHRRTRTLGNTSDGIRPVQPHAHQRTPSSDSDSEKIGLRSHIKAYLKKEGYDYHLLSFERELAEKKAQELTEKNLVNKE